VLTFFFASLGFFASLAFFVALASFAAAVGDGAGLLGSDHALP
jgi:hypothetical protein